MALISAFTLIRGLSLLHLTAAYFLLTNPRALTEQNMVLILGAAMRVPNATTLTKPTETTALSSLLLTLLSFSDLTSASLPTATALPYWSSVVPVRLTALFALTGWIYAFGPEGMFSSPSADPLATLRKKAVGVGAGGLSFAAGAENLKNSFVFAVGFFEVCMWFWVFLLLRDERREEAERVAIERAREEEERKFRL